MAVVFNGVGFRFGILLMMMVMVMMVIFYLRSVARIIAIHEVLVVAIEIDYKLVAVNHLELNVIGKVRVP